jgi:enoyl-CoA hydratase/carnithine racemase
MHLIRKMSLSGGELQQPNNILCMGFSEIEYGVTDRIATVTLKRPDRLNAFTFTMRGELIEAFDLADADDDVRAVVVTGAGRAFCAGADLGGGGGTFKGRAWGETVDGVPRDGGGTVALRIARSLKPVIAAINGPAVGVGVTMTLPMDIRIASTAARFGFVFARRGIVPEAASSWFLPRIVGISQAAEWCYTGRVFPAEEALAGRLVSRVVGPEALMDTARGIAREIADHAAPVSVTLTRALLWRMLGADHPMEAHKIDSRLIYERGRSADAAEGVGAFLQKRPAVFPMRPSTDLPDVWPWWPERKFS